jgi:prophage DNA circulation protein
MSENIYLLTICLPLATIVLVFGMRYFALVQQARARLAGEDATRQMAADAIAAQAECARTLKSISAALADVQARLGSVEKILKQVE